jgi:hypothetical protein
MRVLPATNLNHFTIGHHSMKSLADVGLVNSHNPSDFARPHEVTRLSKGR